jgi:glycosyltransferase involved in cell wall biosynthesis
MISVLIPVFGEDVTQQVQVLVQEAQSLSYPVEIIVVDDASGRAIAPEIEPNPIVVFEVLEKNLGRSQIRNYLAQKARYDILIYLDADCVPVSPHYIQNYYEAFQKNEVLVGGQVFQKEAPTSSNYMLRWKYGSQIEARNVTERKTLPYASFMANNFCIGKALLQHIGFDQHHTGYGHEDTLFGMRLRHEQVAVNHIANPILHLGLETNEEFLEKTDEGIANLVKLYRAGALDHHVRLIATYQKCQRLKVLPLLVLGYYIKRPVLRSWLQKTGGNVMGFGLFKLLGFAHKMRETKKRKA